LDALRIGAAGLGGIWNRHLSAIRNTAAFHLAVVCDTDERRLQDVARETGASPAPSFEALLDDAPDAVVVLTPHYLHASMAIAALEAGCHVLVEKPMANSIEECRSMIEAARRAGKTLFVCDSASYLPVAQRTRQRYQQGDLGRFLTGSIPNMRHYFHDARPGWFLDPERSGGGMFINVGCHRLAMARACLPGLHPSQVLATVGRIDAHAIEACTTALVAYGEGGSMIYQEIGYFNPPPWGKQRARLVFEEGIVGLGHNAWQWWPREGEPVDEALPPVDEYSEAYTAFAAAIAGSQGPTDAAVYAQDIAVICGAYASAERGRAVDLTGPDWRID
jgi:predicted dehydrogenase